MANDARRATGRATQQNSRAARRKPFRIHSVALAFSTAIGCALAPALISRPALAQTSPEQEERKAFNIPAGPLAPALRSLASAADMLLTFTEDQTAGKTTAGVRGQYTPQAALSVMLRGAGLYAEAVGTGGYVLRSESEESGTLSLSPIIVSGEKVERSWMETGASVSVWDEAALRQRPDITNSRQAFEGMANVTSVATTNNAPVVRGLDGTGPIAGADAFFGGVRPRLSVMMDGRPTGFNELVFGNVPLWDVEQMEFFRGPQSTVQGRNAIAGAVIVKTKDPTYTPEMTGRVVVGNYDYRQLAGTVSGPIIEDQMALRLAVSRTSSESPVKFLSYDGEDDPREIVSTNLRGKILLEPQALPGLRSVFTLQYADSKAPQGENRTSTGAPQPLRGVSTFLPRSTSGIWNLNWELNDVFTFENTLSYSDLRVRRHAPKGQGRLDIDGHETVFEPRLHFSAFDETVNGFGGFYGMWANQDEFIDIGNNTYDDKTRTNALFGEATWTVHPQIDLTLGLRLEEENRKRSGGTGNYSLEFDETYRVFLPKIGAAWRATDELTIGGLISRGYNGGGAAVPWSSGRPAYSYDAEYVWNYEIFARSSLLNDRLQLSANAFYADYKSLQLPYYLGVFSGRSVYEIRNADKGEIYGSELGARWLMTPSLEFSGELGLLQTRISKYPNSGIEGGEMSRSPAVTGKAGLTYRPLEGLEIGGDVRYSEAYYSSVNAPRGKTDPYWVANLRVAYEYENVKLFAFANNLFDSQKTVNINSGYERWQDPRRVGVGVEVKF